MLSRHQIERVVDLALEEDAPFGDLTSQAFIPAGALATADLVAREPGVLAGAEVFAIAMSRRDFAVKVTSAIADGATGSRPATCWPPSPARPGRCCRPSGSRSTWCSG